MESPEGTTQQSTTANAAHEAGVIHSELPLSVEGMIARDVELLIARVRERVSYSRTGQREWALTRTKLEEAAHWISEARDMNGGRGINPGWFPEQETAAD